MRIGAKALNIPTHIPCINLKNKKVKTLGMKINPSTIKAIQFINKKQFLCKR